MALEARSLMKCYSAVPAVSGVSFSLGSGEVLGFLGPNGSGETTAVRLLTGLLQRTRGHLPRWKASTSPAVHRSWSTASQSLNLAKRSASVNCDYF
jgi:ABC-type multidrug transport system ATPase subunit